MGREGSADAKLRRTGTYSCAAEAITGGGAAAALALPAVFSAVEVGVDAGTARLEGSANKCTLFSVEDGVPTARAAKESARHAALADDALVRWACADAAGLDLCGVDRHAREGPRGDVRVGVDVAWRTAGRGVR